MAGLTPSQTVGPFFHIELVRERRNVLTSDATQGMRIRIEGRVLDGEEAPVPDAMVEIWQANAHGRYRHPLDDRDLPTDEHFTGFGRSGTDGDGFYWFETIKPGKAPWASDVLQAPHVAIHVFARGLLDQLTSRLYFEDEPDNATDPVLALTPEDRRSTLIARCSMRNGVTVYSHDIILQGSNETVFFEA